MEREAREIQEKLVHANKMTALGTLVSGVAHEINNPNNTIMFNTPMLVDAWNDAVRILEEYQARHGDFSLAGLPFSEMQTAVPRLFAGIAESSRRIEGIVKNLKDFARQEPSAGFSKVDLNEAVRVSAMIVNNQIRRHTNQFRMDLAENLPEVKGRAQKLEQVVINLILNALQALDDPGALVRVSTGVDDQTGLVVLRVKDEGRGIEPGDMERITDPFFTTRHASGGMGLGLSITYAIVREHAGTLSFDSEPGKGTTVTVTLPPA